MKRIIALMSVGTLIWAGGAALAAANSGPEIDNANATIKVGATNVTATQCPGLMAGSVAAPYETWRFSWKGGESDTTPGSTNYDLTGTFSVPKAVWTVNLQTGRGVLTGVATLKSAPASGGPAQTTYTGPMTLITQGVPNSAGNLIPARGWIAASTLTAAVRDGSTLLANVEFQIFPGLSAAGRFGDANPSLGYPDYAVTYNRQAC